MNRKQQLKEYFSLIDNYWWLTSPMKLLLKAKLISKLKKGGK